MMKKMAFWYFFVSLFFSSFVYGSSAIDFDGTNDYVQFPNITPTTQITLESWIKRETSSSNSVIVAKADTASAASKDMKFGLRAFSDNSIVFHLGNGTDYKYCQTESNTISLNTWTHIAGTYDSSSGEMKIYIDGVDTSCTLFQDNANLVLNNIGTNESYIGRYNAAYSQYFDGLIDEVRIWDDVRTAQEITDNMNRELDGNETNLKAYYNFNEGSGTTANDSTSNNYDGTLVNSPTWVQFPENRLQFNGTSSTLHITDNNKYDFDATSHSFAVSAYVKTSYSGAQEKMIVEKYSGSSTYPFVLRMTTDGKVRFARYDNSNNPAVTSSSFVNDGEWHHIVGVKNATDDTMYLYIDGVQDATPVTDTTTGTTANNVDLTIGTRGNNDANLLFDGKIAEVSIFNRDLNSSEVVALGSTKLRGNEDGLVGYWPLDEEIGTTAYDRSAFANNGTISNVSWQADELNVTTIYTNEQALGVYDFETLNPNWLHLNPMHSISGADAGKFDINATSGELKFSDISYATAGANYTVQITSNGVAKTYNIKVVDASINKAPSFTTTSPISTPENNVTVATAIQGADVSVTNKAINFGGSRRVTFANSPSFGTQMTLQAWVKTTVTTGNNVILGWGKNDTSADIQFRALNGKLNLWLSDGTNNLHLNSDTSNINSGEWTHVALVRDGTSFKTYINGKLDQTGTSSANPNPTTMRLGDTFYNNSNQNFYFNGSMNDVRIWNKALNPEEISATFNTELNGNEEGLIAYYKLDETSGTTIIDSSVNRKNGVLNTTISPTTQVMDSTNLTYTLGSDYNGTLFDINSATGVLTFKSNPDYETLPNNYEVNVSVNDGFFTTYKLFDINLTDVAEAQEEEAYVYYTFEDNVQDQTGNGNHGTLSGATYAGGFAGKAGSFDGSDYVEMPDRLILDNTDFTISLKFKTSSSNMPIMGYQNTVHGTNAIEWIPLIGITSTGKLRTALWTTSNQAVNVTSTNSVNDNAWHTVVMTADTTAGTLRTYLDGADIGGASLAVAHLNMLKNYIGYVDSRQYYGTNYYTGLIDEFIFYRRPLSAQQIAKESQAINFGDVGTQKLSDGTVTLEVNATSGLEVILVSNTTDVCTLSQKVVTFVTTGDCNITASQAGNATYSPATTITKSFLIKEDEAPVLSAITNQSVTEDADDFNITLNATDPDGDEISYTASSSDESIATVSIVDGKVVVTSMENANGVVTITVNAIAGGKTTTQTFDINISSVDDAPILDTITNPTAKNEDFSDFNMTLTASDVEGDAFTFTASSLTPSIATVSIENGDTLVISSVANAYGDVNISVRVSQDSNASLYHEERISFVVNAINDAPTITSIEDINASEDFDDFNVTFRVADIDRDDLNITIINDATNLLNATLIGDANLSYVQYNARDLNLTIASTPNRYGEANIDVVVKDANNSLDTSSFKIVVPAVIDVPDINVSSISLGEDFGDFNITLTNIDFAGGSSADISMSLNNAIVTLPSSATTNDTSYTFALTSVPNFSGVANLTITITANGQETNATLPVEVVAINDAPTILGTPAGALENEPYSWTPTFGDIDNNLNELRFVAHTLPAWAELNTTTGEISGTPGFDDGGVNDINISVNDGVLSAYLVSAIDVGNSDRAPIITPINAITIDEDEEYNVTTNIYDPDGDSVSVEVNSSNTALATVAFSDGNITISPVENKFGSFTVGIKATANALVASSEFNVTISPVNDAPIIEPIADITKDEDFAAFSIDVNASDIEESSLTYTVASNNTALLNVTMSANSIHFTSVPNAYGVATIDVNVSDGELTSNRSVSITVNDVIDTNITTNPDGSTTLTNKTPTGNSVDVNITNPDMNTTTAQDGTVTSENDGTTPKIKIVLTPEGDTNTTVSNEDKNSSVNVADLNKSIEINENNENNETVTTLEEFNTTITQKADGSVDVNKRVPSQKGINSELESTQVDVDANGTTRVSGNVDDNNITVTMAANSELNATVTSPRGSSELLVNAEINASVSLGQNGEIVTTLTTPRVTQITQTGEVSLEINTTNASGNSIAINLDGNTSVSVNEKAEISIKTENEEIKLKANGALEVRTNAGGIVTLQDGEGDANISTNANGETVLTHTNPNGATTEVTFNSDGTISIVTRDINGTIIESLTYPANTSVKLGDPVEIYYEDENGEWITKEIESNGVIQTYNSDETITLSEEKVSGNGDTTTEFTYGRTITPDVAQNIDGSTTIDVNEADYNYEINIQSDGGLGVVTQNAVQDNTHTITVANPGADIIVLGNGDMSIFTPSYTNANGTTCSYALDIAYDGSDMVTKHYLNKGLSSEIVTTVIMKIPNASMDVTADNRVVHSGSVQNASSEDVSVSAIVDCSGYVSTTTKIEDQNSSFVAVNKPGSTVIIEEDGTVETSLELALGAQNDIKELKFIVNPDSGEITTRKTDSADQLTEVVYPAGAKVVASSANITEVVVDLSNIRFVSVTVRDENNNTLTSTTNIDASLDVTRTSNGDNGVIRSEMSIDNSNIVVENFINGLVKHMVQVGEFITEATSRVVGADVNVTQSGVTTTFENVSVSATPDAKAQHRVDASGRVTEAIFELLGVKTVIDRDSTSQEIVVSSRLSDGDIDIEVQARGNGHAVHRVVVENVVTQASVDLAGAQTNIDENVTLQTTLDNVVVITNRAGETTTAFTNGIQTLSSGTFPRGNSVIVRENNGLEIEIVTPLIDSMRF